MVIRPLAVGELETFAHVAGWTEHAASVQDYIERLLTKGYVHHEWFVTVQADPECSIGMRMTAEGQLHLECR
jgi:hypothetical protein